MDPLPALALVLTLLAGVALGAALVAARRRLRRSPVEAAPLMDPPPPAPAQPAPVLPASAQEAAMLEALCQDIRARTNGVVGLAELLVAAPIPEDQLRQAELIADSGRTMLRLLGDVLDVARIDAGGLQLQAEPSDLRDLLGHSVNLMQASARARGLSLVLVVDDAVPPQVMLDRARLRQVMLNLIGNAVKFTRQGRIDVQARLAQTPAGPQLAISVIDPGEGIARERQADIFQPFFRHSAPVQPSGTTGTAGGTGLGLALSSRLVQAMGGDIALESAPGLGSCFTVRLPLATGPGAATDMAEAGPAAAGPADLERFPELQSRYLKRKEALFASLQAAVGMPAAQGPAANWDTLASRLYRLAGVAANFGDERLGQLARQLHGELRHQTSPRLRQEVLLRHWQELQAQRGAPAQQHGQP